MSEVDQLQQETEALLQECEKRLESVEQSRDRMQIKSDENVMVKQSETKQDTNTAQAENAQGNGASSGGRSRSKNRAANQAAVQLLIETYPQVFSRDSVRPLKIGIQEELIEDGKVARNRIKRALASYVRSPLYLRSLQVGAERIDLTGQASGQVSEEEAAHARDKLKAIKAARRERQKQERDEQRKRDQDARDTRMNQKLEQLLKLNGRG